MNNNIKHNIRLVFGLICVLFALLILYLGKYILFDSEEVINNPYNPRLKLMDESVQRGQVTDTAGRILAYGSIYDREYPFGRMFSHVVGTVQMGKSGVEDRYNVLLQQPSREIIQRVMNLGNEIVTGDTAMLTLDAAMQELVYSALGESTGAAVVIEPSTGRILAMVSKPDFDPSSITADWDVLLTSESNSPLINRATQGLYPPGSIFKPLTAAAAIANGLSDFIYECAGIAEFNSDTIRCFNLTAHGTMDMHTAMAVSCNGYFAAVTLEMGADALRESCEQAFFNRDLSYAIERGRSSFSLASDASVAEIMQTSIGQGQTLVTPLHMAMVASAIANEGNVMKPYVLARRQSATGATLSFTLPEALGQAFDENTAAALRDMMIEAVETGTAIPASVNGIRVAAKTGTAQNVNDDHGWLIAFAPADNPQIAIAVVTESSGGPKLGLELVRKVVEGAVLLR